MNRHDLEPMYISQMIELKRADERPRLTDVFWVNRFKRKLKERLKTLETDFDNGLVSEQSYVKWKKMINEVL